MRLPRYPGLDDSIGFNLNRVALLYRRELIRALAAFALTPEQWQILGALSARRRRLTQAEIAALVLKDKHSVSRMLERMERAGWITRGPHPEDGRAAAVALGRRRAELAEVRAALDAHFSSINSALHEDEQRQLRSALEVLRSRLEE